MQTSGLMLLSFVPRGRVSGFIVFGVYVGGGRRESRFDRNLTYVVAARNVKRSISMNLWKNKWLWTESKNEEMQLSENEALWLAKKKNKKTTTTTKTIEMFKNQSGAAIFISNFEVARETGFRCCADRIALWGCFDDEFWSSKLLSVWYFFEKHTRTNKFQIELEVAW